MKMRHVIYLISLSIAVFLSCTSPVDEREVPGTYINRYYASYDSIVIKSDGSFYHYYKEVGKNRIDTGTWKYSFEDYDSQIIFSNLRMAGKCCGFPSERDFIDCHDPTMTIFESFGLIGLRYNPDSGHDYYKKND